MGIIMNEKIITDRNFELILKCKWKLISFGELNIFFSVTRLFTAPEETVGLMTMLPEMIEHLLASCVIAVGFSCLVEYLQK